MAKQVYLTFTEHLDELKNRLLASLAALVLGTGVAFFYSDKLLEIFTLPLREQGQALYFFSPVEALAVRIKFAFFAGLVAVSPILASQFWLFVAPALHRHEKKIIAPLAVLTSGLFFLGASFCFIFVLPAVLEFLIGMQNEFLTPVISVGYYASFLSGLLLAFGLAFNLPVVLWALVGAGALDSEKLKRFRRHCAVGAFVLAMLLTPPDFVSQVLMAVPLIALYEISLWGARFIEKLKKPRALAQSPEKP